MVFNLQIGHAQLTGERLGTGNPLIFLHAGVADRRMWIPQMDELSGRFQTTAYDRRGFGETKAEDEMFSDVEDLRILCDHLGIRSASLVGCSQGGRLAIDFALAYPGRVKAMVLIAPAVSGAPQPENFPPEAETLFTALDEADEAEDLVRINEIEANMWLDGPTSPAGRVGGEIRDLFLDMNGIALQMPDLEMEIEPISAYERVFDLVMPVLVIWGNLDFPHIKERCRYLVESIPNAQGVEITGAAHLPNLEQPEAVNALIRSFLE